jgi:NADH dehydrogenase (ubiquinone) Fe-S protein 6
MSAQGYMAMEPVMPIKERKVMCDGGGPLGHPRVFINLDDPKKVMPCMYCGKRFQRDLAH